MPKIARILLSTYNGEKYLQEQLDSLSKQLYPHTEIIIRDDGSCDTTLAILSKYAEQKNNTKLLAGENIGIVNSFLSLLREYASDDVCFFAFCDQDDIWKPDKLLRAVQMIESEEGATTKPMMYCSGYTLLDTKKQQKIDYAIKGVRPSLHNAIVENIATGCTVVLNRLARDLLISKKPQKALMHDAWCYLVISAFGTVIYDPYPSLYYRQHENNIVGGNLTICEKWRKKIWNYRKRQGKPLMSMQVEDFFQLFGAQLDEKRKHLIISFLSKNIFDKIKLIYTHAIFRQSTIDDFILKALYLCGKI